MRLTLDFLKETVETRGQFKENNYQPGVLHLVKIFFRRKGEMKTYLEKEKLREFINRAL